MLLSGRRGDKDGAVPAEVGGSLEVVDPASSEPVRNGGLQHVPNPLDPSPQDRQHVVQRHGSPDAVDLLLAIDYIDDPEATNELIIEAVTEYDTFWTYTPGVAEYSVTTQKELGLVGNGPDETIGNMEEERIQRVIDQYLLRGKRMTVDYVQGAAA